MEQRFVKPLVIFFFINFQKNYNKKYIGLYRDDGLAMFKNFSGSKTEKLTKTYKIFLKITT